MDRLGDFSEYVSRLTKDYEETLEEKFGEETKNNFKGGLRRGEALALTWNDVNSRIVL